MINKIQDKFLHWTTMQGKHITATNLKTFLEELEEPLTDDYFFGILAGDIPAPSVNTHILIINDHHDYIYNRLQEAPTVDHEEHQLRYSFTDKNYILPKSVCHLKLNKNHLLGKSFVLTAPQSVVHIDCNVLSALHTLSTVPKPIFKASINNLRRLSSDQ